MSLGAIYFYVCAALAVTGALSVIVSKSPIRGAMGLLLLILSVAGLFLALHAEFLAAIQLIVYAGAIVVLFLFVIMLLGPSASTPSDRRGVIARTFGGGLFAAVGIGSIDVVVRASMAATGHMTMALPATGFGGIDAFGSQLFADELVPFEVSSALLMVAVIGSIAVARGRQGAHSLSKAESSSVKRALPLAQASGGLAGSGVFSHEAPLAGEATAKEPAS
ncbi:MAG: NADH-quinone oxidoreductase subunit J family protein [Polyangiaceae bacterium]